MSDENDLRSACAALRAQLEHERRGRLEAESKTREARRAQASAETRTEALQAAARALLLAAPRCNERGCAKVATQRQPSAGWGPLPMVCDDHSFELDGLRPAPLPWTEAARALTALLGPAAAEAKSR